MDAHHHFLDTANNDFQGFLGSLVPNESYLPSDYAKDVVAPLKDAGIAIVGSVHVECMPDDGPAEATWVQSMAADSTIQTIVASTDLTKESVNDDLNKLKETSPQVHGIRWILDCVGPFRKGQDATHVATLRHNGIDYLRGRDGEAMPDFERGFAALAQHGLSFDLQCAPVQLPAAARLCGRHPAVKVCINHLGKPRMLLGPDGPSNNDMVDMDNDELTVWRAGMKAMAEQPQVYVKLSMLGYAIPGWIRTPERVALMKGLCREVVELFGTGRCMIALNWWKDGACSDADGLSDVGPGPVEFVQYMSDFFDDYSEKDRNRLFVGTAREFYKF